MSEKLLNELIRFYYLVAAKKISGALSLPPLPVLTDYLFMQERYYPTVPAEGYPGGLRARRGGEHSGRQEDPQPVTQGRNPDGQAQERSVPTPVFSWTFTICYLQ